MIIIYNICKMDIKIIIEQAWEDRELKEKVTVDAIDLVIEKLDKGKLRTAETKMVML